MLLDSVNGVNNINFGKKIMVKARIKPKEAPKNTEDGEKQLATEADCMANVLKVGIKKSDNLAKACAYADEDDDYEKDALMARINEYAKKYGFTPCDIKYGEDHIIFENGGEGITSDGRMVRFQLETAFLNYGEKEDNEVDMLHPRHEVEETEEDEEDEYYGYEDDEEESEDESEFVFA